jgi:hypothetical protein
MCPCSVIRKHDVTFIRNRIVFDVRPVSDRFVEQHQRTVCVIIDFTCHIGGVKLDSLLLLGFRFQNDTIKSLLSKNVLKIFQYQITPHN